MVTTLLAQISPGDLTEVHAHLEGISNCTLCHSLGDKVTNEKCLDCHVLLKSRIDENKGYHSSSEVSGKSCVTCHNDHHGRKFEIVRFDENEFNHQLAGYKLEGAHAEKKCVDCHKKENITNKKAKEKKYTFLGLKTECLNCHEDYHQKTLSNNCASCHDMKAFHPAGNFDHSKTDYILKGKHKDLACEKCHPKETRNEKKFQVFAGIKFDQCTRCHEDVHKNKFGQDCLSCHTEESFLTINEKSKFDHNKTDYRLEGKHKLVQCKSCHKEKYTVPIAFYECANCHVDYHKAQFVKNRVSPDCSECHNVNGFVGSSFTIEKHQHTKFKLEGAHQASPCFTCHRKEKRWEFRSIGINCNDCHKDIHSGFIEAKFYPENDCKNCHEVIAWNRIEFDHSKTSFKLLGTHKEQSCRACHFVKGENDTVVQKFKGLSTSCNDCHVDIHYGQFVVEGVISCVRCHDSSHWKNTIFDHSKTLFPLDGKHKDVACVKCHKKNTSIEPTYTIYKIKNFRCEDCH